MGRDKTGWRVGQAKSRLRHGDGVEVSVRFCVRKESRCGKEIDLRMEASGNPPAGGARGKLRPPAINARAEHAASTGDVEIAELRTGGRIEVGSRSRGCVPLRESRLVDGVEVALRWASRGW